MILVFQIVGIAAGTLVILGYLGFRARDYYLSRRRRRP